MHPEDDDMPVADAAEHQRDITPPTPGDGSASQPSGTPLESTASDWQEQGEDVDLDPEIEELREDDEGTRQ